MHCTCQRGEVRCTHANYSIYLHAESEVGDIVRKCLTPFPWIWVRVDIVSIDDTWLTAPPV